MNDIFNINRFENYLKRSLILHKTLYLYLLAIIGGGYIVSVLLKLTMGFSFLMPIKIILPMFIVFSPCFLEKNINKYNGVFEYTFPVSTFERFFIYLLRYIIFIPLLVFGTYYLLTFLCSLIPVEGIQAYAQAATYESLETPVLQLLGATISFQSVFLLGYLSFGRHAFMKTWLVILAVMFVFSICITTAMKFMLPIDEIMKDPSNIQQLEGMNFRMNGEILGSAFGDTLKYIFPILMWIVCYFKIREKEI